MTKNVGQAIGVSSFSNSARVTIASNKEHRRPSPNLSSTRVILKCRLKVSVHLLRRGSGASNTTAAADILKIIMEGAVWRPKVAAVLRSCCIRPRVLERPTAQGRLGRFTSNGTWCCRTRESITHWWGVRRQPARKNNHNRQLPQATI